ncbi:hypothetical protein C8Q79DRAFT_1005968 [Trametes meyenii]|nr:hypothetical protein C8Q79DRAFT_1005968 [Trametes meyenii]
MLVLATQVWAYCRRYGKDRLELKIIVATIFILATAQQALFATIAWFSLITRVSLDDRVITRLQDTLSFLDSITVVIVQLFYITRTFSLGRAMSSCFIPKISALTFVVALAANGKWACPCQTYTNPFSIYSHLVCYICGQPLA